MNSYWVEAENASLSLRLLGRTNIAGGNSEQTNAGSIEAGAVPFLVQLLKSGEEMYAEQSVWAWVILLVMVLSKRLCDHMEQWHLSCPGQQDTKVALRMR